MRDNYTYELYTIYRQNKLNPVVILYKLLQGGVEMAELIGYEAFGRGVTFARSAFTNRCTVVQGLSWCGL